MENTQVRVGDNRWRSWTGWLTNHRTSPGPLPERPLERGLERPTLLRAVAPGRQDVSRVDLKEQVRTATFAFRGYDVSNLGRSPELLEHRVYGPVVRALLDRASVVCGEVLKAPVDLAARVQAREPSTLGT